MTREEAAGNPTSSRTTKPTADGLLHPAGLALWRSGCAMCGSRTVATSATCVSAFIDHDVAAVLTHYRSE